MVLVGGGAFGQTHSPARFRLASSMTSREAPPFSNMLGVVFTLESKDRVTATLQVREDFKNRNGVMHGGAIMGYIDTVAGTAATINLEPGQSTTTIESKTNFFAAIPIGEIAYAETTPLHRGRSTSVWQTRITRQDGRLAALTIQTQMTLQRKSGAAS